VRAVLAASSMDDPLDNEEQLQDQMESLPAMCRFLYDATCEYMCSIIDPLIRTYTQWGLSGGNLFPFMCDSCKGGT
jgi:exportin-7